MNLASQTKKINRRSIFAAIPALAVTTTAATAFALPDAPVQDMPDMPAWWRDITHKAEAVLESGVPHAGAGDRWTVVSKAKLDALEEAVAALKAGVA